MRSRYADQLLLLTVFSCVAGLAIALISQHVFEMLPCAWCVFQRVLICVIGVLALLALLTRSQRRVSSGLAGVAALVSLGGMVSAIYQNQVAAKLESCDQTFADRFMTASGLDANFPSVFGIWASCADAKVDLLGVSYDIWALLLFALLAVMTAVAAGLRFNSR
ncbi:MAG: disulfide bond formation protein B [Pigmentiphaga sp.]|nr:disulfide bond formation protein B [Pigmentiphaga sp.]